MIETTNRKKELRDFQLLLEGPDKEFLDYGKIMAPNSKLVQRESDLGELIIQENLADKNKTIVLSKAEVMKEVVKYNLAIVKMRDYRGDFDLSYLKSVKTFMEEKKLSVSRDDLKKKMVVLYPKDFIFKKETKNVRNAFQSDYSDDDYTYNGINEKNPTILFEENGFYHIVHKGSNYKTLYNLRQGLFYYSENRDFILRLLSVIFFSLSLTLLVPGIVNCVATIIYVVYNAIFAFNDTSVYKYQFNKKMYDL